MNRRLAAAIATGTVVVALGAPSAALASCNGRPSAANVYSECLAGGAKHHHHKTTGQGSNPTVVHISPQTAKALAHAGKQRRVLASLVHGYGASRLAEPTSSGGAASSPTALGSAFDLGSGPTALLVVLAGTAVLLLAATGVRGWRRSHRAE
jgi:hypothetical protein